jgi:hypothetical protein
MIHLHLDSRKLIAGMLAGFLIAVAAMAGMYAIAATAATSLAAGFAPPGAFGHARITDIAGAVNRASAEHRVARAACKRFNGAKRRNCNAEAEATRQEAVANARQQ